MLWGMVWVTFSRCRLTRPGYVLSMFWLLDGGGQGMLHKHAFGDDLDDLLANFRQCFAFWAAVARKCSAGMPLGDVFRCWLTQRTTTATNGRTRRDGHDGHDGTSGQYMWFQNFKHDIGVNILISQCVDHGTAFLDTHSKVPPD